MKMRYLKVANKHLVEGKFPNFYYTGSIGGMKRDYYGKDALLVRCGNYVYNVSSAPDVYYAAR